ncbi:hypothetical protein GCM10020000_18450 [Streptomyces olivoverticillatus]
MRTVRRPLLRWGAAAIRPPVTSAARDNRAVVARPVGRLERKRLIAGTKVLHGGSNAPGSGQA